MSSELSNATLPMLRARGTTVPRYDRSAIQRSVLHFGPGAFHRVHQAWYFDSILQKDSRWGITEVSLQTASVRDALTPQDGLYVLSILDDEVRHQVIGSIADFIVARESSEAVLHRIASPETKLITATLTEKGYCLRAAGGLDVEHSDIQHDLAHPERPRTFIGYLVEGMRRRRNAKQRGLVVLSCDNLTDNGLRLKEALLDFANECDRDLANWIEGEVAFPRTMVDSITPATDEVLRNRVATEAGIVDRWPVQREAFTQWVIESSALIDADKFSDLPDFESVGVTLTRNVGVYEQAKLRLLNGAHSTLAYVGMLLGHELVSQAMNDVRVSVLIDALMNEVKPSLRQTEGFDLNEYCRSLCRRFRNPALPHRLSQIAWDGSQKIPYRLLGTIRDNLQAGRSIACLSIAVAAWFQFIRYRAQHHERPVDPLADELQTIGQSCDGVAADDVGRFFRLKQMFTSDLTALPAFRDALILGYERLTSLRHAADVAVWLG